MGNKAVVFGSTGLVGSRLIEALINESYYEHVLLINRKELVYNNSKVESHTVDLRVTEQYTTFLKNADLYICLGTTIKKAGSISNMEYIDKELPLTICTAAKQNGVGNVAIVSSIGANSASKNYYLRIKGEFENELQALHFQNLNILRPSILLGKRNERRFGERIGKIVISAFGWILVGRLKKYRGIQASTVAKAMIFLNKTRTEQIIFESDKIKSIVGKTIR